MHHDWRHNVVGVLAVLTAMAYAGCSPDPGQSTFDALYERDLSGGIFDITPVRGTRGTLALRIDGEEFPCSMCHDEGFTGEVNELAVEEGAAHEAITFDHGPNKLCINCHHPENADDYIDYGNVMIPGDQPTELCRKCHGPHHREWKIGVHGRVNGTWQRDNEAAVKLDCIQCHDPHRPKFQPMKPEPAPVHTRFDLVTSKEHHDGG